MEGLGAIAANAVLLLKLAPFLTFAATKREHRNECGAQCDYKREEENEKADPVVFDKPDRVIRLQPAAAANLEDGNDDHGDQTERSSNARDDHAHTHYAWHW